MFGVMSKTDWNMSNWFERLRDCHTMIKPKTKRSIINIKQEVEKEKQGSVNNQKEEYPQKGT
jgi:hypothetical protein